MPSMVLTQLHYLPPIEAFVYFAKANTIILEGQENYQKGSYRNRCHIIGANGVQRLSIPLLKGKHSNMPIKEVTLAYHEPWLKVHWQSIKSAYGNAPFFFYYGEEFEAVFKTKHASLWSFNLDLLKCAFKILQWDKHIEETFVYQKNPGETVLDIRKLVTLKRKPSLIFPEYPQVFKERHGFTPNLSILDLLFCLGPQSELYLQEILPS